MLSLHRTRSPCLCVCVCVCVSSPIEITTHKWVNGIADETAHNVVRGNTLTPYGNECVDIKEGSYNNLVENNVCQEQYDDDSGCYGSRGDNNVFRCALTFVLLAVVLLGDFLASLLILRKQ